MIFSPSFPEKWHRSMRKFKACSLMACFAYAVTRLPRQVQLTTTLSHRCSGETLSSSWWHLLGFTVHSFLGSSQTAALAVVAMLSVTSLALTHLLPGSLWHFLFLSFLSITSVLSAHHQGHLCVLFPVLHFRSRCFHGEIRERALMVAIYFEVHSKIR